MSDLGEFLRGAAARRRETGVWDCCTFPAAWAMHRGWPDPMAEWRAAYSDEEQAHDFIHRAGSLAALFTRGMAAAGIPEATGAPEPGDIAVVTALGAEAGAVFTGKRWALVSNRGMGFVSLEAENIVASWRVGHG